MSKISRVALYFIMIFTVVIGTACTIVAKLIDMTEAKGDYFNHAYL